MRNAEDSKKASEENRISAVMDKINTAIIRGEFEVSTALDYVQVTLLEREGYAVEKSSSKSYTISWN